MPLVGQWWPYRVLLSGVEHLQTSDLQPSTHTNSGQDFIGQGHYGKIKGQIKVTP